MDAADSTPNPPSSRRGVAGRALGLLVGVAIPAAFLSWALSFDAIKRRINGRLWCSDADDVTLDVQVRSSGSSTRFNDVLVCKKDGAVLRAVGDMKMLTTTVTVSVVISALLIGLLIGSLLVLSGLRRAARAA